MKPLKDITEQERNEYCIQAIIAHNEAFPQDAIIASDMELSYLGTMTKYSAVVANYAIHQGATEHMKIPKRHQVGALIAGVAAAGIAVVCVLAKLLFVTLDFFAKRYGPDATLHGFFVVLIAGIILVAYRAGMSISKEV